MTDILEKVSAGLPQNDEKLSVSVAPTLSFWREVG